jgi:uncharacterized Zn finger protein (UPF0148 family)
MSSYTSTCQICDAPMVFNAYGKNVCPKCGQQYDYDEGQHIVLSDEQRELLKKGAALNPEEV